MDKKKTLKQEAYDFIKRRISTCKYMPGELINELRISEETGIGRTPVREAITALCLEGFVDIRPRKGTYVSQITREAVLENYQIRSILEPAIITQYIHSYNKLELMEYDKQFKYLDFKKPEIVYALDISFHKYLINICRNDKIIRMYNEVMNAQFRMGMYNTIMKTNKLDSYSTEHHDIILGLLMDDTKKTVDAILTHIRISQMSTLESIQKIERVQ